MITINMNSAALCRLEQQDRARTGVLPDRRATAAGTGPQDGRGTAQRSEAAAPMPEHTRG